MTTHQSVLLPHRGVLAIAGDDRKTFLQGLVSNDVTHVADDRAIHAAFLTPQGKFLHEFFISERDGTLFLDAEAERLEDLRTRLSRYRLRAKVTLEARPDLAVAVAFGAAKDTLHLPSDVGAAKPFGEAGVAYVDPRLAQAGLRFVLPRADAEASLAAAGFTTGIPDDWEEHRLRLGLPDGSRDLTVEKALLMESGFEELHGIDFKKGCYIGQELTARMKYRALVKKRLMPVTIDGPLPAPGTPLTTADGKDAGEMRSGVLKPGGAIGLALIRLEHRTAGPLHAGAALVSPVLPDWMRLPEA
ncbi:YgfZ/GcvT domain-containing protein [Novispirillum sp. DQ9]|uniref:CAF17-like 4Fe-4S cluster assembly/insertion protein YgfZ n=1 Tax=Novispirillum sp. DQ9 TaxID=3398612 RepID=UPI003C7B9E8F